MAEDDVVFQDAVEALREGKKARARELLTGLLKPIRIRNLLGVDECHHGDTQGRIYWLQTALKLDPENVTAKTRFDPDGGAPGK